MSLLDTVKKNLGAMSGMQPQLGQTTRAQELLRTRATGKAAGPGTGGPAPSAIAEETAAAGTRMGLKQVQEQGQLSGMQLGQRAEEIERGKEQQVKELQQRERHALNQYRRNAEEIAADLRRKKGDVDLERDALALNKLGFASSLMDMETMAQLDRSGKRDRLMNDQKFEAELLASVFAMDYDMKVDYFNTKKFMDSNDREFEMEMARMSVADAWKMFESASLAANERAKWEGVAGLASGGAQAYAAYDRESDESLIAKTEADKIRDQQAADEVKAGGNKPREVTSDYGTPVEVPHWKQGTY